MHLACSDEGFTTVQAIECNDAAAQTCSFNNPDVTVFRDDIRMFVNHMKNKTYREKLGCIHAIHFSNPCQVCQESAKSI